ncbi:MAG TPA: hypothetical protein VMM13_19315 [Euzebya sp.]|nr:hypothetical protein [Euzebya sp.]
MMWHPAGWPPAVAQSLSLGMVALLIVVAGALSAGATTGEASPGPSPSAGPSAAGAATAPSPTASSPTAEASPSQEPGASVGPPLDLERTPDPAPGADPEAAADLPAATEHPVAVPGEAPAVPVQPDAAMVQGTSRPEEVDRDTASGIVDRIHGDAEDDPAIPDLLGNLLGEGARTIVWHHHDLGASVRMFEHLFSHQARLLFSAGLWVIAFASWLLGFVLRFGIGDWLAGDLGSVADAYADFLKEDWGELTSLMYLLAVAHAAWQVFRHRGQAAVAELLVAVIIALVGGFLLSNADRAACVGLGVMADLTVGTVELTRPDGGDLSERHDYCTDGPAERGHEQPDDRLAFEDTVLVTFVTEPFLLLQWGRVPDAGTSCRMVADALVQTGPWGDDDYPRDRMNEAGCSDMVAFNNDMTVERVTGAAVYMLSAWALAAAVILTAGTLLAAQVAGALLVVTMPFAVVLGISPGAGREILARWGHGVLKVGVLFVGSGFFLAIMITAVGAVQRGSGERSLLVRMLASVVVAWSLVILRGRLFKSLRRASHSVAGRVAGPGLDVGGVARSPTGVVVGGVVRAAEAATYLHGGARALQAGASAVGTAGAAAAGGGAQAVGAVGRGLAASGRQGRLLLASRLAARRAQGPGAPGSGAPSATGPPP